MPDYKLSYFGARGFGEPIRYVLAYKKADWENDIVANETWSALKPKTPMGQIPLLTLKDGRQLAQSKAILRFVSRELGVAPTNNFEAAEADMLIDSLYGDLYPKYSPVYMPRFSGNEAESKQKWAAFKKDTLPAFLDLYEKYLAARASGWFVGDKVSYADFVIGEFMDRIQTLFDPDCLKGHPKLAAHAKKVAELPGVKEYIAQRKPTIA